MKKFLQLVEGRGKGEEMKKTVSKLLLAGLLVVGMVGTANASIIFSDNFEADTVGLNKTDFLNWTVSDGTVDLIGTNTSWNFSQAMGNMSIWTGHPVTQVSSALRSSI